MSHSPDPAHCPLCGGPNECQLCTQAAYKGPCWCATLQIPEALIARVPADLKNKACICRQCVMEFHRGNPANRQQAVRPGEFYFDPGGLMVLKAEYLLRRGYCCSSGCRHCPYPAKTTTPLSA